MKLNYSNFDVFDGLLHNSVEIASILVALEKSMTSKRRPHDCDDDTLFLAGLMPQAFQICELTNLVHETGWNVVYLCFIMDKLRADIVEIDDVVCCIKGSSQEIKFAKGGKIWQSGCDEKVSIVFPEEKLKFFKSRKGQLRLGGIDKKSLEKGYDRARATLAQPISLTGDASPVLTNIGSVPVVHTLSTMKKAT